MPAVKRLAKVHSTQHAPGAGAAEAVLVLRQLPRLPPQVNVHTPAPVQVAIH